MGKFSLQCTELLAAELGVEHAESAHGWQGTPLQTSTTQGVPPLAVGQSQGGTEPRPDGLLAEQ
ncbi:hypothetical protein D3C76_1860170 [compost metagenome]